ncbi:acyl-CoA N-acyltransferase [Canariomyces notabilis]|uniref:Acyl-CoA N-acyltransferase n=1 Tax=Canariomyces notabilis TaxID=2074819 RepID=A0AAN6TLL7_9PEZI|nr:acyl-CoA N-acyltransferase [Canariomyces arenarius]
MSDPLPTPRAEVLPVVSLNTTAQGGDTPASTSAPDPATFVRVRTTLPKLPLPSNADRVPVTTARLLLRPLAQTDLPALHVLRTQPEVMHWTAVGKVDPDMATTQARLNLFMPPNDAHTYNCAICLRDTGELIGVGGSHVWKSSLGWPEVGYMLRREYWGKGLGTEFLRGFLEGIWEGLEREVVELEVDSRSVSGCEGGVGANGDVGREADSLAAEAGDGGDGQRVGIVTVPEQLIAITAEGNGKSQAVLVKTGFEWFVTWKAPDSVKGDSDDGLVDLPTYRYFPGRKRGGIKGKGCDEFCVSV